MAMTKVTRKRVDFRLSAPTADKVDVAGSFIDWQCRPLRKTVDGRWQAYFVLKPGVYEYRYIVDGRWQNDPEAGTTPNPFGSENCVVRVE